MKCLLGDETIGKEMGEANDHKKMLFLEGYAITAEEALREKQLFYLKMI